MWLRTIVKRPARWLPFAAVLVALIVGVGFGIRALLIVARDPLANLQWRKPPTDDSTPASVTPASRGPASAQDQAHTSAPEAATDMPGRESSTQQAPVQTPRSDAHYTIQLGAFRSEARASKLARTATQAGFASSVITGSTVTTRGAIFRVQLDGVFEKIRAEQLSIEVRRRFRGVEPIIVVEHR